MWGLYLFCVNVSCFLGRNVAEKSFKNTKSGVIERMREILLKLQY